MPSPVVMCETFAGKKKKMAKKKNDTSESESQTRRPRGLHIEKGARHCKILDAEGETVFRTTNLRDAEHYVGLVEENERLQRLLEARGVAPHRIYMLAAEEDMRGKIKSQGGAASEVVIVAKADDGVVVRHLDDGREEIVDLDEIEQIEGGMYLQASEVTDETVHVVLRYDREGEAASVTALRSDDKLQTLISNWSSPEEIPGNEYAAALAQTEGDVLIYQCEVSIED